MSTEQMREEFEAWAAAQGLNLKTIIPGVYRTGNTTLAWKAWKASRAELRVELPEDAWLGDNDTGEFGLIKHEVVEAIEAAGVRVK